MKLILVFIFLVAAGPRTVNSSQVVETTTTLPTETTEFNMANRLMNIITYDQNVTHEPEKDNLRILSNIVKIDIENEAPVEIRESRNASESVIVIKDQANIINQRQLFVPHFLIPVSIISLVLNFSNFILAIVLYSKYPVIRRESKIYMTRQDVYDESSSLTSSCE